jgi:uncharacterized phage-associated protein
MKNRSMAGKSQLEVDLLALSALPDDQIDTSDIPERTDFSNPVRQRFYHLTPRHYDVRAIANWCLRKAFQASIVPTSMWLNKIVYFIHEAGLREYKILLTDAKVEAWSHGPVFREIYYGENSIDISGYLKSFDRTTRQKKEAAAHFLDEDLMVFEEVWSRFGVLSPSKLRNISHQEGSPWYLVWNYKGRSNPGMEIDVATILGQRSGHVDGID